MVLSLDGTFAAACVIVGIQCGGQRGRVRCFVFDGCACFQLCSELSI